MINTGKCFLRSLLIRLIQKTVDQVCSLMVVISSAPVHQFLMGLAGFLTFADPLLQLLKCLGKFSFIHRLQKIIAYPIADSLLGIFKMSISIQILQQINGLSKTIILLEDVKQMYFLKSSISVRLWIFKLAGLSYKCMLQDH